MRRPQRCSAARPSIIFEFSSKSEFGASSKFRVSKERSVRGVFRLRIRTFVPKEMVSWRIVVGIGVARFKRLQPVRVRRWPGSHDAKIALYNYTIPLVAVSITLIGHRKLSTTVT